jgi:hypothetical protein
MELRGLDAIPQSTRSKIEEEFRGSQERIDAVRAI